MPEGEKPSAPSTPKPEWDAAVKDYGGAYLSPKNEAIGPRGAAFPIVGTDIEWNSKSEAWDPELLVRDPAGGDEPLRFRLNATNRKFVDEKKVGRDALVGMEIFVVKVDTNMGPGLRIVDLTPAKA